MASARRYLTIAFSFTLALTALSILGPKTVHAVSAALVQVTNTAAQPVPITDVNNPAHTPFEVQASVNLYDGDSAQFGQFSIPAGNRLVVETLSAFRVSTGVPAGENIYVYAGVHNATENVDFALPVIPADGIIPGTTQNLKFYVNPGGILGFGVHRTSTTGTDYVVVSVSGYLVPAS